MTLPFAKPGKKPKKPRRNLSAWREAVLRRDGGRCRLCGYHGQHVSAHHLIFLKHCAGKYAADVRNGITVGNAFGCGCHEAVHSGRRKIPRSALPRSVLECLEEQGLTWMDGTPYGPCASYFAEG